MEPGRPAHRADGHPADDGGEAAAERLKPAVAKLDVVAAFSSPAERARRTAELAGLQDVTIDPDLWEWDYGGYEGRTTKDIQAERPGGTCGGTG